MSMAFRRPGPAGATQGAIATTAFLRGICGRLAAIIALALFPPPHGAAQGLSSASGDWIVMADEAMSLALTTGDHDTALGVACGPDCILYIESDRRCADGHVYPVIIAAPTEIYGTEMACHLVGTRYLLVAPPDARFLRLADAGGVVKFVVAGEGGRADIFRFSLAGSAEAIALVLATSQHVPGATADPSR